MADGSGYSAGNLEFQIQAMEKNTTATFSKLNSALMTMMNLVGQNTSSLKSLQKTLTSISRIQFNSLDRLAQGLNKLNAINLQGLYQKINSLSRILTPLGSLSSSFTGFASFNSFVNSLNKMSKIDIRSFYQQINSLTRTLKPLLEQLTLATPSLQAFSSAMNSVKGKGTIKFSQFADGGSGKKGGLGGLGAFKISDLVNKVYFIRNYTKQMFRSLIDIVNKAVEYTETLNLWQVAMRGYREEAEEFVATMNKAYGISTQTLMQYQAIFKNMLSSLGGINGDVSYQLSEFLTQMALDYASLYNTTIEKAMTTFQSVLSGQVRPIRSIAGYDITETTIYQLYQQLGGTKTMRQLSQTEKRLLRIYAVFQQMESSGAIGDLEKTLGNTANQQRIFAESTKELATWLGIVVENYVKPYWKYLNAFVITLTNITKAIVKMKDIKFFEGGAVESVEQVNEALDEVQGKLLSFDRFEALNSEQDNNILGIDESLLSGLSKYTSILSGVSNEAQEIAEKWTAMFIDPETGGWTDLANTIRDITKNLGIVLGIIFVVKKPIIALVGALVYLYSSSEQFRGTVNEVLALIGNTIQQLLPQVIEIVNAIVPLLFMIVSEISPILGEIVTTIVNVLKDVVPLLSDFIKLLLPILEDVFNLVKGLLPIVNILLQFVGDLLVVIIKIMSPVVKFLTPIIDMLVKFLVPIIDVVVNSLSTVANLIIPMFDMFASALGMVIDIITGDWEGAWQNVKDFFASFGEFFKNLWQGIANTFASILNAIANMFIDFVNKSIDTLNILLKPIDEIAGWFGGNVEIPHWDAKANWKPYKNGGLVEDGLFQMSKGEVMGTFDDGTSIVANNQQIISGIQQGVYSAVVSAMRQSGGNGGVGDVYLDGRKVGQTTSKYSHQENVRIGLVKATR